MKVRGCRNFRQRIVLATLSGRVLRIDGIRQDSETPGIQAFEASFLRLVDKLCDGSRIEINETGTKLRYAPGIATNGRVEHRCEGRGIGYFVEGILPLVVFGKRDLTLTLTGMTNDAMDHCVDTLRTVTVPLLASFGVQGAALQIKSRGAPPQGGGEVVLTVPVVRELAPVDMTDFGLVKRIRGVAFTAKVSPQVSNRLVESARGVLNRMLPDVWIYTDHYSGRRSGNSPGFGVSLVAETTTGCFVSAEACAEGGALPEDLGADAACALLEEVSAGGCIDGAHQGLALMLMALTTEDVSRVRFGSLTDHSVQVLQLLRDVFGTVFRIREDRENGSVILSNLGNGHTNVAKKIC